MILPKTKKENLFFFIVSALAHGTNAVRQQK